MDLVQTVRKEGSRGGRADFKWEDVKNDAQRENYLGHSLMAPVGRWQQGRDLGWYAKGDEESKQTEAERIKEEKRKIKEAEEDAMLAAMGLPVPERNNANLTPLGKKVHDEDVKESMEDKVKEDEDEDRARKKERKERSRRHRDEDDRERKRRHRSRSRSRDRERRHRHRERSRSRNRRRDDGRDDRRRHRSRSLDRRRRDEHRRERDNEDNRRRSHSRSRDRRRKESRSRSPAQRTERRRD